MLESVVTRPHTKLNQPVDLSIHSYTLCYATDKIHSEFQCTVTSSKGAFTPLSIIIIEREKDIYCPKKKKKN